MKKRGYTLIELISVMSILIILFGSGFTIVGIMKKLKAEVEFEQAAVEISNILSYGKSYCRKNSESGKIIVDIESNTVIFTSNSKDRKKVKIDKSLIVSIWANGSDVITISEYGYLTKAGNVIMSNRAKQKIITIAVGNDKVTVKPGQDIVSEIEESE